MEYIALWMFPVMVVLIFSGYPVAFALGGTAVIFTLIGSDMLPALGIPLPWEPMFRTARLNLLPQRIFGSIMDNYTLVAVPFFVFMGVMLEKSGLAEDLLKTMGRLFGRLRGGLAISVVAVGALLAASTGVVGASVVTMAVLALPVMLRYGYSRPLAGGVVAASGTLGQIIPPSIVLIILGDQIGANVGDLFLGALLPGLMLSALYVAWVAGYCFLKPQAGPPLPRASDDFAVQSLPLAVVRSLLPPLALVAVVLGSIFMGLASPTEAGAMGAFGATLLALANRRLNGESLRAAMETTVQLTSMVFIILVGATAFAMVFNALDGNWLVRDFLVGLPGGEIGFLLFVMLTMFVLGFFLDFIEITFIIVPLIGPAVADFGFDLVWFGVLLAMNLQASFLTPPFGFSLFYLRGAAPPELTTGSIYRGIVPFVVVQLIMLAAIVLFPELVLWLPTQMRG